MDILIPILAVLAGIIGIAGSILPGLPGTPFSWAGLLLLYIWGPEDVPLKTLIIWGVITVIVSVIDYVVRCGSPKSQEEADMLKEALSPDSFSVSYLPLSE